MDLQYIFMVLATFSVGLSHCQLDEISMFRDEHPKKTYCGQRLSETLSAVCRGNYNTLNKKSDIYNTNNNFWASQYTPIGRRNLDYPFRNKASAKSITNFRRRKRGVFNECCEKPCSHHELASYCGR